MPRRKRISATLRREVAERDAFRCSYCRSPEWIGVPMGDDPMLSYQCTSFHDAPALRQIFKLGPLPEFEQWMVQMGLWDAERKMLTEKAGDPTIFVR